VLELDDGPNLVDLAPWDMDRVARERRRDAPEEAASLPGVAADDDFSTSGSPVLTPAISRSSTLPQLRPSESTS